MTTLRRIALAAAAGALAVNSACYAYAPVVGADLKPAETVRVMLTSEGTTALAGTLRPNVTQVDGKVSTVAADGTLALSPDWLRFADGNSRVWAGAATVNMPAKYLSTVELKKLDKKKTVQRSVLGVGVAIALAVLQQKWVNDSKNGAGGQQGTFDPPTGDH